MSNLSLALIVLGSWNDMLHDFGWGKKYPGLSKFQVYVYPLDKWAPHILYVLKRHVEGSPNSPTGSNDINVIAHIRICEICWAYALTHSFIYASTNGDGATLRNERRRIKTTWKTI